MQPMPIDPQLSTLFEKLNDDLITVSWKWQILRSLFGTKERVDLLSATAPTLFRVFQTTFADDIFLTLSRITDPPQTRGRDNLTITRLKNGVQQGQDPVFHEKMISLTNVAIEACSPFRQHRHKRLAHSDLNARLQTTSDLLPKITVDEINRAIEALQNALNEFNRYYFDRETVYKVSESGGVKALFTYLQKGLDACRAEEQQARAAHGMTSPSGR